MELAIEYEIITHAVFEEVPEARTLIRKIALMTYERDVEKSMSKYKITYGKKTS